MQGYAILMVSKCQVPNHALDTENRGSVVGQGNNKIIKIAWPIKKRMHFKQTQAMVSTLSHCFRHSSFIFTAASGYILLREFMELSPLYPQHPTVHIIKPFFLHAHLAKWRSVLQLHFTTWSTSIVAPETTFARSDFLQQIRLGATC